MIMPQFISGFNSIQVYCTEVYSIKTEVYISIRKKVNIQGECHTARIAEDIGTIREYTIG